jgi:RNA-directed DNA polymerase
MDELNKSLSFFKNRLAGTDGLADEYAASNNQASYYKVHKRKKKSGGYRFIYRPLTAKHENLASIHKQIYDMLVPYQSQVHDSAHGFIKGKSTLSNAKSHAAKKYILHIDKGFF